MNAPAKTIPLLTVNKLNVRLSTMLGAVHAVDNVSFTLGRGRTLALVGESGCGKSMLARTIMGLLPSNAVVSKGSVVEFNKRPLLGIPGRQLRQIIGRDIGLVFQDPLTSLNPVMTIGRQVAEGPVLHLGISRQEARERTLVLLKRVGIPMAERRMAQYPHQLSGGLRQRVAIAIALACEPQLLIADEPTTALDVTIQADILNLLSSLQKEKQMAMILITHDLGVVARWSQEAAVMYAGQIVEHAQTRDLFKHIRMPYTQALMDAIPRLTHLPHTELKTIDGQPPDLIEMPPGCRFAPRCCRVKQLCREVEPEVKCSHFQNHQFKCWYPLNAHDQKPSPKVATT